MHSFYKAIFYIGLVVGNQILIVAAIPVEQDLALTLSEKNALDKFKERVLPLITEPWMKHDIALIRWLRARNFNLDAAEAMLKANIQWRKENKMDQISKEDWSEIMKDFPSTTDSEDRDGRPLGTIDIYSWNIRQGALQGKGRQMLRYMDYLMENGTQQVIEKLEKGMNVTQWVTLGNADGFNVIQHACALCIPLWIQFIQSLENNYPGWLDEYIIIDSPSTISIVLEALRPFLSRQTRDAFRIFGPNRSKWLPYLESKISKENRRPQYGGTKPNPTNY